jgi:predicted ATPase/DNA-binding SARP family transcriptional activator
LAGLLWGDLPETSARANLRKVLSNLHQIVGPWLLISRTEVAINPTASRWLDVAELESGLHDITQISLKNVAAVEQAVALYTGTFLDRFDLRDAPDFEVWSLSQRARLHELMTQALDALVHYYTQAEGAATAIRYAKRLVDIEPWREESHQCLMRLLARSGERSAALRQYEACRKVLAEELGVEPAEQTTALYGLIRDGKLAPRVARESSISAHLLQTPILSPQKRPSHRLPNQTTPIIGRETEVARLSALLADPAIRLVTISGTGGMGKTRLAIELALVQFEQFDGGAYFVSLTPVDSTTQMISTIAETIGFVFHKEGDQQDQLFDFLRTRSLLLVLDNFDHLLAKTGLITQMLQTAPGLKILVTTRSSLRLQGEQLFPIGGLEVPQKIEGPKQALHSGAIKLFVHGACRVRHDFVLTDGNVAHVVQICRLVGGMPLAILLAAAWIETLMPAEIEREISQDIDFLEMRFRDAPERHWSVRAVFDYSWALMTERERQLFQGLSVFHGGFTYQAAQAVTKISLQDLRTFVNKSLLSRTPEGRYQIHDLLRQYATKILQLSPATYEVASNAHCAFYCALLHAQESKLKTAHRTATLAVLWTELQNLRAAWNWAILHVQTDQLNQAMESLAALYQWRGRYREGEEAFRMLAEKMASLESEEGDRLLANALIWQANFNRDLGRTDFAIQLSEQSLALLESPIFYGLDTRVPRAAALYSLGAATLRHDYDKARNLWNQSYELYLDAGEHWGMAHVLGYRSMIAWELGLYDEAKHLVEENLAIQETLGNQIDIGNMYSTLGWISLTLGQFEEAEQLAHKCMIHYQESADQASIAKGHRDLAAPKMFLGRFIEAHELLEESVALFNELGGGGDLVFTNILQGETKAHLGQYRQARSQQNFALQLARNFEDRAGEGRACLWLGRVALAEGNISEAQLWLQESTAIFRSIGQRDQLGAALASLGHSEFALGNVAEAHTFIREALQIASGIGAFIPLLYAVPLVAMLEANHGEAKRAVELYALTACFPFIADSHWFNDVYERHISDTALDVTLERTAETHEQEKTQTLWAAARRMLEDS